MLEERIYKEYIDARRNKDTQKLEFLSFLWAELKNYCIEKRKETLDDNDVLAVLTKQKKRLSDAKESIAQSGRPELLQNAERELAIIESYLPQPLPDEELVALIKQTIVEVGASSMKDMGKVMKEVLAKTAGRADSRQVSELVKRLLSHPA